MHIRFSDCVLWATAVKVLDSKVLYVSPPLAVLINSTGTAELGFVSLVWSEEGMISS
jgi:hypothetical protein